MRSKTQHFELIADSRFNGSEETLRELKEQTLKRLNALPTVKVDIGRVREYHFPGYCTSWRMSLWVNKERATTWRQIHQAIADAREECETGQKLNHETKGSDTK